ncbi:FecR family protein [Pedobacter deserti]|uniref:FecR family protein n=1 Tax=Pedobacter deserti TaxID=2817382 RepID=UPI00210D0591|nr:FecR domain-containing protein [Pedobacter sp. SYSU D00382]
MEQERLHYLLTKHAQGNSSVAEQAELDNWFHELSYDLSDLKHWMEANGGEYEVADRLYADFKNKYKPEPAKKIVRWIAIAAACAVLVSGVLFFVKKEKVQKTKAIAAYSVSTAKPKEVQAGKTGATLTLASGKKIYISDKTSGQLAEEAGVRISLTKDGRLQYTLSAAQVEANAMNMLETAKGEQIELVLPDNSLVFLNAASSIKYAANFADKKERKLEITGEAYFEVEKDKRRPFIVKAGKQSVQVLGTRFNIKSYADEPDIRTTLIEGSVKINAEGVKSGVILKPDQQAAFNGSAIMVAEVEAHSFVSWKEGKFLFVSEDMESIMRQVSRWYNVDVSVADHLKKIKLTGSVSRFANISTLLEKLEQTGQVDFKWSNGKLIATK